MTTLPKDPWDLRKVLREIKGNPADYHETDIEIDPDAEIAGVYATLVLVVLLSDRRKKVLL